MPVQTAPSALFAACRRGRDTVETALAAEASQLPLWIPVAFGIGIAAYLVIPWSEQRLCAAAVMATLVALAPALRGAAARVAGWAGVLMLLGFGVAWVRTTMVAAPRLERPAIVQLVGTIAAVELRTSSGQIRLRIVPFDPALPPAVRVAVADSANAADSQLRPGARVSVTARLAPPSGPVMPGGYDFARHAWFEQLGASGSALGRVSILAPAPPPTRFAARLAALRADLTARLKLKVPGVPGSFAAAFVTGDQGAIPKAVAQAMRDSGLAHLLSISGLHIAIVAAGTLWTLRKLMLLWPWLALRIPVRAIAATFAAVAAIGYTLLAGSDIPTVRACLAAIIVLLGVIIGREALTLRMVAAAAFLILLLRPEALLSPSFQLSFAAVTGLVALYQSRFGTWLNTGQPYDGWFVRLARATLALVVTGLVAETMLSATALYHFNRTGVYGVIANIVAIPLTSFVIMPL
ncbi:ComEC/Rec2 family competence protein [Polymorphobacter arshaanensis]|uniref:ComEC/Rec2 family competence protein n=1 Tax=Glacieibacterium arshaanense TaxID=2511025 RepID=UPI00140E6F4F|nr:ComEC/Rec2 family competence protein [Polymorphobacter arshaanensis]